MKAHFLKRRIAVLTVILLISTMFFGCASFISKTPDVVDSIIEDQYDKIGMIDIEMSNWNWFFQSSAVERKENLEQQLFNKAEAKYGKNILLSPEISNGSWSPASLLMLFNTIGFVEDAYMQASVWQLKPAKVIDAKPINYGIRYVVIPEENYTDETGFMLVEYKTRKELEEDLLAAFNNGDFNKISMKNRQSQLPATGKIFITLGREDIRNAISRWFTFVCTNNSKTIFRTRGIEDIPYVYGTDRFWWNDMSYNVGPKWDGELNLKINDSYQNRDFNFKVVKEIYEIPEE